MLNSIKASPLYPLIRATYIALRDLPQLPAAYLHPWRRTALQRLTALKDVHKGERAFIIGNGPSLKNTDLTKLKGEITFGMNRIYLMFPELGFQTTYLSVVNDLVIEQTAADLAALNIPKFLAWRARRFFTPDQFSGENARNLPTFLYTAYDSPGFARDVRGRVWEGATVTYVTMQLAFHMGIREAILIGVDHSYNATGKPNTTVTSTGDDPNHFDARYFGAGFRWQLPDLETSEIAYAMARRAYERAGRRIVDATVDGKLTVFPKVAYHTLFAK
ncbi:MAG: DUF115 domain-containing protein [Anaerolineales bacterium]